MRTNIGSHLLLLQLSLQSNILLFKKRGINEAKWLPQKRTDPFPCLYVKPLITAITTLGSGQLVEYRAQAVASQLLLNLDQAQLR